MYEAVASYLWSKALDVLENFMSTHSSCSKMYDRDGKPMMGVSYETDTEMRNTKHVTIIHGEPPELTGEIRERTLTILYAMLNCGGSARWERVDEIDRGPWGPWRPYQDG